MPNFLSNCRSKGLSSTNRHLFRINELGGEIRKTTNRGLKVNWNYYKVGQLKDSLTFLKERKNIKKKKKKNQRNQSTSLWVLKTLRAEFSHTHT